MRNSASKFDVVEFHAGLQATKTVAACASQFKDAIGPFGFTAFACGEIDISDRDRNVMFIVQWPKSWLKYYIKSGFIERDPILNALKIYRGSFTWTDIIRDRRFSSLEREALRQGAEHGWAEGLAMAIPRGRARFGLVTMLGRANPLTKVQRQQLCVISECLLTRVRSLVADGAFPVPPAGLSKREIECLKWVARGCSDTEIATTMAISKSTAHNSIAR